MMAHCSGAIDMASGKLNPPRFLIGRVMGPLVKPIYTNEKTVFQEQSHRQEISGLRHGIERGEEEQLKRNCVRQFHQGGEEKVTNHPHPFFGALSPEEWSGGMYKHMDHHLRQFGV